MNNYKSILFYKETRSLRRCSSENDIDKYVVSNSLCYDYLYTPNSSSFIKAFFKSVLDRANSIDNFYTGLMRDYNFQLVVLSLSIIFNSIAALVLTIVYEIINKGGNICENFLLYKIDYFSGFTDKCWVKVIFLILTIYPDIKVLSLFLKYYKNRLTDSISFFICIITFYIIIFSIFYLHPLKYYTPLLISLFLTTIPGFIDTIIWIKT